MQDQNSQISESLRHDDEIDLFELFASLAQQWRWIVGITTLGVVLSLVVAFGIPKEYEVTAQVAAPDVADAMLVRTRGYSERDSERDSGRDSERFFQKYHDLLVSPANLKGFLEEGDWLQKFFPEKEENKNLLITELRKSFKVEIISPKQPKKGAGLPPRVVALNLTDENESLSADFINAYIRFSGNKLVDEIVSSGQKMATYEIEEINKQVEILRKAAKNERLMLQEKLNRALFLAENVDIKKPDSIRLYAQSNQEGIKSLASRSLQRDEDLFLMGTEYLKASIENLQSRESDDPYIEELPPLLQRIDELKKIPFDFKNAKLYKINEWAVVDGKAEKPKRALIVSVGMVLSLFIAIFVALIVGAIKRRKAGASVGKIS